MTPKPETPPSLLPVDWTLTDEESKAQGRISPTQEGHILRILMEDTKSALIASETGFGKTLVTCEVAVRAGWSRVLLIIIGRTFSQWQGRLAAQSDGQIQLRRMDSTEPGMAAWADFEAGKPGFFAATINWLNERDVRRQDKTVGGFPVFKIDKKTGRHVFKTGKKKCVFKTDARGDIVLLDRPEGEIGPAQEPEREVVEPVMLLDRPEGAIGPAQEPERQREREAVRLGTFRKMSARKSGPVDAVIFDESHQTANRNSQMRKALIAIAAEWKIALSATWAGNDLAEHGWATPRWLWPDLIPAYWTWLGSDGEGPWFRREPILDEDGKPKRIRGGNILYKYVEKEPGAFVRSLPLYIRGENPEQAPEPIKVFVDPTPEQAAQYADLKEDLMTWAKNWDGDHEPLVVDIPAVLRTRLRQVALAELSIEADGSVGFAPDAASAKLRALRGLLDNWGGQPVVLMTDSRKFAQLTARRMTAAGYRAEAWVGGLSDRETERIKAEWLSGDLKYIVLTVQAGGTGLDFFQLRSSKIIWLSIPQGDPKLEEQALGRVFRQGMTTEYGPFQHIRLMQRDSLDVEILEALLAKGRALRGSIGAKALAG